MIKFFNYLFIEESAEFIGPGLFVLNKRKLFNIFLFKKFVFCFNIADFILIILIKDFYYVLCIHF